VLLAHVFDCLHIYHDWRRLVKGGALCIFIKKCAEFQHFAGSPTMTDDSPSIRVQLAQLRDQLAKLKALRGVLGDALTDQKKAELESRIQTLVDTGGGALIAGDVEVDRGDFVGRDKWQVILGD
jgi:hypothetical protein